MNLIFDHERNSENDDSFVECRQTNGTSLPSVSIYVYESVKCEM